MEQLEEEPTSIWFAFRHVKLQELGLGGIPLSGVWTTGSGLLSRIYREFQRDAGCMPDLKVGELSTRV